MQTPLRISVAYFLCSYYRLVRQLG